MTIKIGDKIRVIPESYMYLSKAGYLSPDTWRTPNPDTDTCAMLGGEYEVLDGDLDSNHPLYTLLPDSRHSRGRVSDHDAIAVDKVELCPFSVDDTVKFNCRWSERDFNERRDTLHRYYGFDDPDAAHKITHVINDCFVLLDYELDDPFGTPFFWHHLSKVD